MAPTVQIIRGDALKIIPTLDNDSIDAVVCDPPYGLEFMGKDWDSPARMIGFGGNRSGNGSLRYGPGANDEGYRQMRGKMSAFQDWCAAWAAECLRVLKPGGHLLAFGGTRTWHRLTSGIEDAGFEIRDTITWLYASGFPKSLDVSKAIDKAGGDPLAFHAFAKAYADAVTASPYTHADIDRHLGIFASSCYWVRTDHRGGLPPRHHWERLQALLDLPTHLVDLYDEAERQVLAVQRRTNEPSGIVNVGQGPRTVIDRKISAPGSEAAHQWSGWGTALKPASEPIVVARKPLAGTVAVNVQRYGTGAINIDACRVNPGMPTTGGGGWAAHRVDATEGWDRPYANGASKTEGHTAGRWPTNVVLSHASTGDGDDACADGCAPGCPVAELDAQAGGASRFYPTFRYQAKAPSKERPKVDGVAHSTVKPLALMRWLVTLVTPSGGTVLDPFAGSGTTLEAAALDGFNAIGVEREADYLPLIRARLDRLHDKPVAVTYDELTHPYHHREP